MKFLSKNTKYFATAIGIVLIWRGIWGLLDIYLLPNNPTLGLSISIFVGILILLLINGKNKDIEELV